MIHRRYLLALLLALGACRSPEEQSSGSSQNSGVACICGTPEAAMDGCPHSLCLSGQGNRDNPDCVCGPLQFAGEKK